MSRPGTRQPRTGSPPGPARLGLGRARSAQPLDDRGVGLSAALAHGLEAVAAPGGLEVVEQGRGQPHATGAERMADGDGTAAGVEPLGIGVEGRVPTSAAMAANASLHSMASNSLDLHPRALEQLGG